MISKVKLNLRSFSNYIKKNEIIGNFIGNFFILILGAVLTYFIIPPILDIANKNKYTYEKRIKKSIEIINHNRQVNQKLNMLQTALELFHKDQRSIIEKNYNYCQSQKEMKIKINALYLDFESVAWYWYWTIYEEAKIIEELNKKELDELNNLLEKYDSNIVKSTEILSIFWDMCLRKEYKPKDTSIDTTMSKTRKELKKLYLSRDLLIRNILKIFLHKK